MIQRLRAETVETFETARRILGNREQPLAFAKHLAVELDERPSHAYILLRVHEVAIWRVAELVGRSELVHEPGDFVRMPDEIRRELGHDGEVDRPPVALAEIDETPGCCVRQDLVLRRPREGHADQFCQIAARPELFDQYPNEAFGAAGDERHLRLAYDNCSHCHASTITPGCCPRTRWLTFVSTPGVEAARLGPPP